MPCNHLTALSLLFCAVALIGCNSSETGLPQEAGQADNSPPLTAFEAAKLAAKERRWNDADSLIRNALLEDASSPDIFLLAAEITNGLGDQNAAVDYIVDAAIANEFRDEQLVNRAVIGFVSVGKLYEAIEFLEQVVEAYPDRSAARRQLFDFLVYVEEKHRATPHGRKLVRQRQFDRGLLFSLSSHEQRDRETESMTLLSKRNPKDQRLKIAGIQSRFDIGQWEGIEEQLDAILQQHPDNIAAQLLQGRYFVANNQIDRLAKWSTRLAPKVQDTWQYWEIIGDWSFEREAYAEAARAYWESTRLNLDVADVFGKLAKTLGVLKQQGNPIDDGTIQAVQKRAQLLGRFTQEKDRFYKFGSQSSAIAASVANSLVPLGRYWEAEAWAAFATTIPGQGIETAKAARKPIVALLRDNPPWQISQGHPVVDLDLSQFPRPEIEQLASMSDAPSTAPVGTPKSIRPSVAPTLSDQAIARGLIDASDRKSKPTDEAIPLFAQMESGGCSIDIDLDGWTDLYIAESGGTPGKNDSRTNHLFRNRNGMFEDVTIYAGVDDTGFAQGVTFGDVNEDGFSDLVVLNYGVNRLFINNGDGTFRSRDDWWPAINRSPNKVWSTSAAIADLNGDGISDLFCSRYCAGMDAVQNRCKEPDAKSESPCLPTQFAADRDQFLAGTPTGRFEDVTDRWTDPPVQLGRGLGVVAGSLDSQAGIDLFVANDMTDNHYWSPVQTGESASKSDDKSTSAPFRLIESATIRGLAFDGRFRPQACMGIATADLDEDGDIDLFVTNFEQEHNTLYEQTSSDVWSDQTTQRGIRQTSFYQLGFGAQAVDFDNDSHLELVIANGHVYRDTELPATYRQRMQVLRRSSTLDYEAVNLQDSGDYVNQAHVGRALWTMDANRDSKVDVVVVHQHEPLALLINETLALPNNPEHSWIRLRLVGRHVARDAIGATVTVKTKNMTRMAPLISGDGFYCGNERVLHFGLGKMASEDPSVQILVRWPDGEVQETTATKNGSFLIVQSQTPFALGADASRPE